MPDHHFVVCTGNTGYEASLEQRKLYEVIPDSEAAKHGHIRVIDESGEDYLFLESFFMPVELPEQVLEQLVHDD